MSNELNRIPEIDIVMAFSCGFMGVYFLSNRLFVGPYEPTNVIGMYLFLILAAVYFSLGVNGLIVKSYGKGEE